MRPTARRPLALEVLDSPSTMAKMNQMTTMRSLSMRTKNLTALKDESVGEVRMNRGQHPVQIHVWWIQKLKQSLQLQAASWACLCHATGSWCDLLREHLTVFTQSSSFSSKVSMPKFLSPSVLSFTQIPIASKMYFCGISTNVSLHPTNLHIFSCRI